jgi:hypothetical protein
MGHDFYIYCSILCADLLHLLKSAASFIQDQIPKNYYSKFPVDDARLHFQHSPDLKIQKPGITLGFPLQPVDHNIRCGLLWSDDVLLRQNVARF